MGTGSPPECSLGEGVYVADEPLTGRDYAAIASGAIDWLPDGTGLTIEEGQIVSDGYTWYEVSSDDYETRWVAGEFIGRGQGCSGLPDRPTNDR